MQKLLISAAAVATLALVGVTAARGEGLGPDCGCEWQAANGCECDSCGGQGCFGRGRHGHGRHHHQVFEGQQAHFNCGCNGSYKFPVPPLSTYHWPGMWSHQLMTDYHSPWRFPAIKAYADEAMPVEMGSEDYAPRSIHQASAEVDAGPAEPLSFSSRVRLLTR